MNDGNWIKLNRSMLKWEWYDDVNTKAVFLHALLKANYEDGAYRGHKLCPGDVVFGRKKWAEQLGMSEQQVRTAIDHLKETGEISTIKTTNRFTILRIENWTLYQSKDDEATNKQPTSNQQATNKQPRTKKEKNDKKDKNIPYGRANKSPLAEVVETMPEELQPTIWRFVRHRTTLQAPISRDGLEELLKRLIKISNSNVQEADEILRQSIANGWKMIKPLEKQNNTVSLMDRIRAGEFDE